MTVWTYEGPVWNTRLLTYSYAEYNYSGDSGTPYSSVLTEQEQQMLTLALSAITAATNGLLTFVRVADTADSSVAPMLRVGNGRFGATASEIGETDYTYNKGQFDRDVVVRMEDPAQVPFTSTSATSALYSGTTSSALGVMMHELLHALGFGHNTDATSIMYPTATTQNRPVINADGSASYTANDAAMIRSLYSAAGTQTADLSPYAGVAVPADPQHAILSVASSTKVSNTSGTVAISGGTTTSTTTTTAITPVTVTATVGVVDGTTGVSSTPAMTASAAGGPSYLQWQYIYSGGDSVAMSTTAPNVFLHSGSGSDALQVASGQNVLDGGTGSNFLTGGTGADTFFTDARGAGVVWNTIRNFHAGDAATLWGFDGRVSSYYWESSVAGASGSTGATLRANIVGGSGRGGDGIDASITFAGLSVAQGKALQVSMGTQTAGSYLYLFNSGV